MRRALFHLSYRAMLQFPHAKVQRNRVAVSHTNCTLAIDPRYGCDLYRVTVHIWEQGWESNPPRRRMRPSRNHFSTLHVAPGGGLEPPISSFRGLRPYQLDDPGLFISFSTFLDIFCISFRTFFTPATFPISRSCAVL